MTISVCRVRVRLGFRLRVEFWVRIRPVLIEVTIIIGITIGLDCNCELLSGRPINTELCNISIRRSRRSALALTTLKQINLIMITFVARGF